MFWDVCVQTCYLLFENIMRWLFWIILQKSSLKWSNSEYLCVQMVVGEVTSVVVSIWRYFDFKEKPSRGFCLRGSLKCLCWSTSDHLFRLMWFWNISNFKNKIYRKNEHRFFNLLNIYVWSGMSTISNFFVLVMIYL